VSFILAIFGCVVLHEFGHALTAKRYGIRTRDITLLPIGGVARLERMPENPRHELWVALAGPAVNVVIAAIIFVFLVGLNSVQQLFQAELMRGHFLARLMWVNLFLVGFNLLPAFPMDGGRVLRALLAHRMGRRRATQIAASVGQGMAFLFGLLGLFFNPMLIFIAFFVYIGAQAEAQMVEFSSILRGLTVRDGMQKRFRTLAAHDALSVAVSELLAGAQQDFPVLADGSVAGMLRRKDLVKALSERGATASVESAMCRECRTVQVGASLERALEGLRQSDCAAAPVLQDGQLIGLLTLENVSELVMINAALEGRSDSAPA
jgi:Zn-dependent protease